MHVRSFQRGVARELFCCVSFVLLLAGSAPAQPAQQTPPATDVSPPAYPATAAPAAPAAGQSSSISLESFVPALPPSVVPPRLSAPRECSFPHSAFYEHPTRPTVVTFTVTAQGRVTNAAIAQSSGGRVVDEAVRDCVSGFIYAPAMRDGAPIDLSWAWEYSLTISRSRVPPTPPPDAPQGMKVVMMPVEQYRSSVGDCERWHRDASHPVLVAFDVEPDGSVKNASVAAPSGDAATDRDAVECVSRRVYKAATRDGQPVEMRITAEVFGGSKK